MRKYRHVRSMRDRVEHPVAEHSRGKKRCNAPVSSRDHPSARKERRPTSGSDQTVRDRIIVKIKRRESCNARSDTNVLETEEQKDWPEKIDELNRGQPRRQRHGRRKTLSSESDSDVANEHASMMCALGAAESSTTLTRLSALAEDRRGRR